MRCNESGWLPGQARDVADDAEARRVPRSCGAGRALLTGTADDAPDSSQEDRSLAPFADGQVDRPRRAWRKRNSDNLPALAGDHQGPVPPLDAHGLDVGAGGLGDAQPVEGQQRDQRMLGGPAEPGGDQQSAELVTVQPDGVRLVIQPRAPYVGGVVLLAPAGVLAQVQLVGLTGLDVAAGPRSASRLGRGTGPGSRRPQRQPDGADGAGGGQPGQASPLC